ncbi:MAG: TAXI family TRAP transporter solute-binding subunit [Deferrisomatales bacterium]|nr:TAXI family TRAP transporter solute-binding subunit [Deferrisomatales bacterium]
MRRCWLLAVTALVLSSAPAWATEKISVATGGTGGVYYPYGGGMAEIVNKHVAGVEAVAEVTAASVENVRLVDRGESAIGLVMGDTAFQAFAGTERFTGDTKNIRTLFVMYPNQLHIVVRKGSGIAKVSDLKGKRISMGAPGSGTAVQAEAVLSALGLGKRDYRPSFLSFNETADALKNRTIDAGIWSVAPPTSSIMDLATTHDIEVLSFSDEELEKIHKAYPYYSKYEIPGGLYRGVDRPVPNPSVWNVAIVSADMPEELAYELTKAIFENHSELVRVHRAAEDTRPKASVVNSPIPLHPGAARYLTEQGLTIPEELVAK